MSSPEYVLGSDDPEIARLDAQAAAIEGGTAALLTSGGIGPGMRVLELGTGLGHVAFQLSAMVGPDGSVIAIDQARALMEVAEARQRERGAANVRFIEADAREFRDSEPFDAVVARLLFFHLPDAADVVQHHREALHPGGRMVLIDFDTGTMRAEPPVELVSTAIGWVEAAFRSVGANPHVGARLARLLSNAGFADVVTFGVQPYCAPDAPEGPAMLAGVVRALAGPIVAAGIATAEEIGVETIEQRLSDQLREHDAVMLLPALVGAWGTRP